MKNFNNQLNVNQIIHWSGKGEEVKGRKAVMA
jgi:hypothetical protein